MTATQPATKATRWRRSARIASEVKGQILSGRAQRARVMPCRGAVPSGAGNGSTIASNRAWPRKRRAAAAAPARRAGSSGSARGSGRSRRALRAARGPGRAWWMPEPNARWRFGVRAMSSRSGSANCAGIAVGGADAERHRACRGAARRRRSRRAGRRDAVAELVRALEAQELLDRACAISAGSASSRALCSGQSSRHASAVADQVGRRLVAGVEQEDAVVQQLGSRSARSPSPRPRSAASARRCSGSPGARGGASTSRRGRADISRTAALPRSRCSASAPARARRGSRATSRAAARARRAARRAGCR